MKFNFTRADSIALTARCADRAGFMKSMKSSGSADLAHHIATCPACRRVALDALHALTSSGLALEPPAILRKLARKILSDAASEEMRIVVTAADGRIRSIRGIAIENFSPASRIRFPLASKPVQLQLEVELDGEIFALRMIAGEVTDAVAVLKDAARKPLSAARRLEGIASWPGLRPGRYRMTIAGREGSLDFVLDLAMAPES